MSKVRIKSAADIERCRTSSRLAAETLLHAAQLIEPGITTLDIDRAVHSFITDHGAIPSPLNYHGFPKSVCTSINEVVCHGIPDETVLKDGDIINVDVTVLLDDFHGDTSATFFVGTPSAQAKHVTEVARQCLDIGIEQVAPGRRLRDIGGAIEDHATAHGCSVVRDYVGHGIGRQFHEPPQVPHFRRTGRGPNPRLMAGWVFTIEPMINAGDWPVEMLRDGWTVLTKDRSLSAQFEHTLLVTPSGVEVLTDRVGRLLPHSEDLE